MMMMMMSAIVNQPSSSAGGLVCESTPPHTKLMITNNKSSFSQYYKLRKPSRPTPSTIQLLFRVPTSIGVNRHSICRPFSAPVMEMQDCTVKMEVDVPASVAYNCYSDRESIPKWMPFISSVQVVENKPDQSRWSLKYQAFGRDIEFSWLARNLQPIPNQKIHWRSVQGLANSGAVRFYPKGPSSCLIELTVSYEVPQILVPVASALQPFLQSLLLRGLESFSNYAKSSQLDAAT